MNKFKIVQHVINSINCVDKQQKSAKGLKFVDCKNLIDESASAGVIDLENVKNINAHRSSPTFYYILSHHCENFSLLSSMF